MWGTSGRRGGREAVSRTIILSVFGHGLCIVRRLRLPLRDRLASDEPDVRPVRYPAACGAGGGRRG